MGHDEVPLTGGMVNEVTRIGDTVRRTAGPWTPAVHALLQYLHRRGFRYSPVPLGIDERGREILTYLDGEPATRPWPEVVRTDAGIRQMAEMIAELRSITSTFAHVDDHVWRAGGAPGDGPRTIRHGDVGPWNMLWNGDRLVGLIDWDFAEPAPALWDFAQLAWYAVPLNADPGAWADYGFSAEPDYAKRLDIVCDAAGCTRAELNAALHAHLECERGRIRRWGSRGVHPFDSFLRRDFISEIDALTDWLARSPLFTS